MATTHDISVRNGATDYVVDRLDAGSANASGKVIFKTSGDVTLVELPLSNPAFGDSSSGTATANSITSASAVASGTAAKYDAVDRDGNVIFSGTVTDTGGGGDAELDNTSIASGQTVGLNSFTYTALSQ